MPAAIPGASEADRAQRRALDPAASVWVSASAGTGKTKVLTERLLTLMLNGTEPARILCLTFTRAAAAEMANRVNERLAKWTTMPSGALAQELVALTGRYPSEDDIKTARRLFSRVLDTPGGAKIATIHAFCQSLLRRFPLEAKVPPEFTVIDERSASEALKDAAASIIAGARAGARPDLAAALEVVARYLVEERFAELMAALARERGKLTAALGAGEEALEAQLAAAFGMPTGATEASLATAFCAGGDLAALRQCCAALSDGTDKTDQPRGRVVARWCEDEAGRPAMTAEYLELFLTQKGEIRQELHTKSVLKKTGIDLARILGIEAERAKRFLQACNALIVIEATRALVRLGERDSDATAFETAIATYNEALEVFIAAKAIHNAEISHLNKGKVARLSGMAPALQQSANAANNPADAKRLRALAEILKHPSA